ncbi:MAG: cysteine--tRNA ligase [Candidatus Saccharimonas sp.]
MIHLYNTRTKTLEPFTPHQGNTVLLYTCGPTVYDNLHVGNWASFIYWDILVRILTMNGFAVNRVMNITDVGHLVSDADDGEDKLEKGARREGKTAWEVAQMYSENFVKGLELLNMVPPNHLVKATEFIEQQLDLVRILKEKGYTYQIDDGIYFDTAQFPDYATFANLDLESQKAGARVEVNNQKRSHSDFALWKFTPAGTTRDMEWETPVDLLQENQGTNNKPRMGFPGWHLECSAIAMSILGPTIDIHTGGIDHIPVHHTNEIAQSEAASGQRFARFWLHNNHIKIDGTKISKSLGNTYTLEQLAERGFTGMDLRMFILQGQYSNEGNFTFENLAAAKARLHNWKNYAALRHQIPADNQPTVSLAAYQNNIQNAIANNLNTPAALKIIDESLRTLDNVPLTQLSQPDILNFFNMVDDLLGLHIVASTPPITSQQKNLIAKRQTARTEKDWTTSDTLRDQLESEGIILNDTANGTSWGYAS